MNPRLQGLYAPVAPGLHRRLRRHPVALAAAWALVGGACAQAQTPPLAAPTATAVQQVAWANALPSVTVTATLTEQDARTAPASVTVIDRDELAARNASDLLDAVRGAPGLTLSPRQVGGRKTLALRLSEFWLSAMAMPCCVVSTGWPAPACCCSSSPWPRRVSWSVVFWSLPELAGAAGRLSGVLAMVVGSCGQCKKTRKQESKESDKGIKMTPCVRPSWWQAGLLYRSRTAPHAGVRQGKPFALRPWCCAIPARKRWCAARPCNPPFSGCAWPARPRPGRVPAAHRCRPGRRWTAGAQIPA